MNVRDLIDELSRLPQHLPVRIFVPEIIGGYDDRGMWRDHEIPLSKDCDFAVADIVRYEGSHVMIEGK